MSLVQEIKDGKVVASTTSTTSSTSSTSNTYDEEMFLQLLVAEMQYQDPLEPTSNTEYVSELASFSQIEATQNVSDQMDNLSASQLVGKYVVINDGDEDSVSGMVDYIKEVDGEYKVSVDDTLYSLDDVDIVADEDYYSAVVAAQTFTSMVSALPDSKSLTTQDEEKVTAVRTLFDSLSDYQKQFISTDSYTTLTTLESRLASLKASEE